MKLLKVIIVAVLILAICVAGGLALVTPAEAQEYSWKDSWIEKLKDEIEQRDKKIAYLTFELGENMLAPVVDLLFYERDCDDATAYMLHHFQALGYKVDIIWGNLERTNETKSDCDHVWVLVHSGNQTYAYDWGRYYDDDQHYEGYTISYKKLLYLMMQDR